VRLPIPNIDEQKKYVALYKGLLNNQKVYENSLDDLQLICDTYIEDLIKTAFMVFYFEY
jgi:type I restriction enzyme S subunit